MDHLREPKPTAKFEILRRDISPHAKSTAGTLKKNDRKRQNREKRNEFVRFFQKYPHASQFMWLCNTGDENNDELA
ncbi:MAG: hypothetical protein GX097_02045 [Methanomicrobiales archaeon]|nr:hypothetical protein [Methanomicrobiales archaeon]